MTLTDEEMEEGELPEEGELVENDEQQEKTKSKTAKAAAVTSAKAEQKNDTPTSKEGVEEFIKKKRQELAEKVKNQLRRRDDSTSDANVVQTEVPTSSTASTKKPKHESTKSTPQKSQASVSKYQDLDKTRDPSEAMISNWAKGARKSASSAHEKRHRSTARRTPSPMDNAMVLLDQDERNAADPYDEYYGTTSNADVSPNGDVDYRLTSVAPVDQDYRYDIDYRRVGAPVMHSDDDDAFTDANMMDEMSTGRAPPPAAIPLTSTGNEFGDIDERLPPPGGVRQLDRAAKRAYSDESKSTDSDDDERLHGSGRSKGSKRHRSRSPTGDDSRRGRGLRRRGGTGRNGTNNDRTVCKFFREGYCREGESCSFSHDVEPPKPVEKRGDLCKYYMSGFCRNGPRCPYLHGDYPCKFFHKGECTKGDECRYSHEPLNETTRPLFERMLKDEELAAKVSVPNAKSTRKVLLGAPPPMPPPQQHFDRPMSPPMQQPPMQQQHPYRPDSPSMYYQTQYDPYSHPGNDFNHMPMQQQPPYYGPGPGQGLSPIYGGQPSTSGYGMPPPMDQQQQQPYFQQQQQQPMEPHFNPPNPAASQQDSISMGITAVLRQIKADVKGEDIEESPASPEPSNDSHSYGSMLPPTIAHVSYKLILVDVIPFSKSSVSAALLQASFSDSKLRNDPRIKNLLSHQFDAVSDLISHQTSGAKEQLQQQSQTQSATSQVQQQQWRPDASRDPRARSSAANARDPRLSRQSAPEPAFDAVPPAPYYQAAVAQEPPPLRFEPAPPMHNNSNMYDPMLGGGPYPNVGYGLAQPLGQQPVPTYPPGGWMPQMNNLPPQGPAFVDFPPATPFSNLSGPPPMVYNGPPLEAAPASAPPPAVSKDPRRRNVYPQSRFHKDSPPSGSTQQQQQDYPAAATSTTSSFTGEAYEQQQQNNSTFTSQSQQQQAAAAAQENLSLRERRKNLQYESPLSEKNGASEESKYN